MVTQGNNWKWKVVNLLWQVGIEFLIFSFIEKLSLLFALPCLPVCNADAVGWWIVIRVKVEQNGRWFLILGKTKKITSACQSGLIFLFKSHLLTFRHLMGIERFKVSLIIKEKKKESNEGDSNIKGEKNRVMREIWLSKHMHSLSLTCRKRGSSKKAIRVTQRDFCTYIKMMKRSSTMKIKGNTNGAREARVIAKSYLQKSEFFSILFKYPLNNSGF